MIRENTVRSSLHADFEQVEEKAVTEYLSYLNSLDEITKKRFAEELRRDNESRRNHGLEPVKRLSLEHVQRVFDGGR